MIRVYSSIKPPLLVRFFIRENWTLRFDEPSVGLLRISGRALQEIPALDTSSIEINRGILWNTVIIRTRSSAIRLEGLSDAKSHALIKTVSHYVNDYIGHLIRDDSDALASIDATIASLTKSGEQYLAKADISELTAAVGGSTAFALSHPLFSQDLLPQDVAAMLPKSLMFLTDPDAREKYNSEFLRSELSRFKTFFDEVGASPLTDEQREACIRLEDSNLLVAAAGSGKTATIVAKVAYLLKKQLYEPEQILVLAFNADAAEELRIRIAAELGREVDELACQICTFHALGRKIISDVTGAPPELAGWVDHPAGETKLLDRLIKELSNEDLDFAKAWRELLIYFPKADLPESVFSSEDDFRRYMEDRRDSSGRTITTLEPDVYVRSLQEQKIVNWLWSKSVNFRYEESLAFRKESGEQMHIMPDFYYPDTRTYHEHFAIDKRGRSHIAGYVAKADEKRRQFKQAGLDFFETKSADAHQGKLLQILEDQLLKRGFVLVDKTDKEVEEALKNLRFVVERYHRVILTCIKHIRSAKISNEMLEKKADDLHDKPRARRFVKVLARLAVVYQEELDKEGKIDFESMIGDAIQLIEAGKYNSHFKLILVDEFQDISEPRAQLVKALKNQVAFAKLFVVGDDWQSIYRFAGSDITIFTGFDDHFGDAWIGRLQKTFRSHDGLAKAASAFVQANPEQMRKDVSSVRPELIESIRYIPVDVAYREKSMEMACHSWLDRFNTFVMENPDRVGIGDRSKLSVLVLARYNHFNPAKIKPLARSHLDVEFLTFHRAKGLEADYTVLLDVSEDVYGVPSRIADDELLNLVIPLPESFPHAEERRLFYVALTRATHGVRVLYDRKRPSRFLAEVEKLAPKAVRRQELDGSPVKLCPKCKLGSLVTRRNKRTGDSFEGCSIFPECDYTSPRSNTAKSKPSSKGFGTSPRPPVTANRKSDASRGGQKAKTSERKVHRSRSVAAEEILSESQLMRVKRRKKWAELGLPMDEFPERDSDQVSELKKHLKSRIH